MAQPGESGRLLGGQPSLREIELGKRILELEREKEGIAAELAQLKAKVEDSAQTRTSATSHTDGTPSITIPPELLPTFSLLRDHIASLTRDNEALRYTFLGTAPRSTPAEGSEGERVSGGVHGVNLEDVVVRVKELVKENEELGEMVLSAGKASAEDWEMALEDSRQVISSLDSDLSHHLSTIQSLRQEVDSYRAKYGPLGQEPGPPVAAPPTPSRRGRGDRGHARTNTIGSTKDFRDSRRGGRDTSPDNRRDTTPRVDSGRRGPGQGGRGAQSGQGSQTQGGQGGGGGQGRDGKRTGNGKGR